MVLAVLEARGYFRGERKPCLDFETWCGRNRSNENGVGKAWVLPYPLPKALVLRLLIQELNGVELDQISKEGRELRYDF